jgi:ribonuclease PH
MRPVKILRGVARHAEGSAWIRVGNTQVLCTASVEERLPYWLRGKGHGWVTAEYGMLPRSVPDRSPRGKVSGRSSEIQRFIGRCLRAVVALDGLGDRQITVDCDVLDADGGTRVASLTAAWVALHDAFEQMRNAGALAHDPLKGQVAAISVGLVDSIGMLDLSHSEDARAQLDLNVVGTLDGKFVEVQGAAEGDPFDEAQMRMLLRLARRGLTKMFRAQEKAIASPRAGGFDLVRRR